MAKETFENADACAGTCKEKSDLIGTYNLMHVWAIDIYIYIIFIFYQKQKNKGVGVCERQQ